MANIAISAETRSTAAAPPAFAVAIFLSASLVFMVQPMIAKMILPLLGGSPAVWNASMAFFQAALLAGYAYAHALQRLPSLRLQALIHLTLLGAAALFLPLHVSSLMGEPTVEKPVVWLLGVLALSVGAPFAVLSATAPLLQAWYARVRRGEPDAENPYVLYAASNLGSMLALLAYPLIVEPAIALNAQTLTWTAGYGLFAAVILGLTLLMWKAPNALPAAAPAVKATPISWTTRLTWVALAAVPTSLMLGVTTYISTDVASAPFMWVLPLALYLLTFVVAFQAKPVIGQESGLIFQAAFVALCAAVMSLSAINWGLNLFLHLGAFFFSALICHQALVARRPEAEHLTEFYLLMSLGGVVGGAFNAFLAPVIFNFVAEYPIVLALAGLARPWGQGMPSRKDIAFAAAGVACALAVWLMRSHAELALVALALLVPAAGLALMVRGRALLFTAVIGAILAQAALAPDGRQLLLTARSFFGVHRVKVENVPELGGPVNLLFHGTTLHGAEPQNAAYLCRPSNYYASVTAIGQTYLGVQAQRSNMRMGVVGLGGGSVAAYVRPGDSLRFFEIDPEVNRIASNPAYFRYMSDCAKGPVDVVLGDARLTVAREPAGTYDLIHLDAFSSDAIPTHLLTVEALNVYFRALKPNGVLLLHISNRNLALEGPAAAAAKAAGATALVQRYRKPAGGNMLAANSTDVMILSRDPRALAAFAADPRWRPANDRGVRAWTDDYTNVAGALIAKMMDPGA